MSDTYKCAWCGRHFEKSAGSKFLSGASMGLSNLGKKYCSKSCEHAGEESKSPSSKEPDRVQSIYQKSDVEVQAKLEEKRMEHEQELLEEKLSHEREMAEQKQKHELRLENIRSVSEAVDKINHLDFGGDKPTPEVISRQLELCFTLASSYTSETFNIGGMKNLLNKAIFAEEKEKFNQSEKVVNAAIKKAELGVNKLRLCEPQDKALNFYNIYNGQLKDAKIKQIERKWDHKVLEAKPTAWVMVLCCMMVPLQLFVIYKLIELNVLLPKKRNAELSQMK